MRRNNKLWQILYRGIVGLFAASLMACTPAAPPIPTVDTIGTMAVVLAAGMMSQTAAAYTPTPFPVTETPLPPSFTETPVEPTWDPANRTVVVITPKAPCYFGPGPAYNLESNISQKKEVNLLGVGSVTGWYIIENPYFHQPCWIKASDLRLDPRMDLSVFPVISP